MKKIVLSVSYLICSLICFSQMQRMMIPAGEYLAGAASEIRSFCLDQHLPAPDASYLFERGTSNMFVTRTIGNATQTRPFNEVNGSWVKLSGSDENWNILQLLPVNADDGATYKLIVRDRPGRAGSINQDLAEVIPPSNPYQSRLNQITDGDAKLAAKQVVIWNLMEGNSPEHINQFLARARQLTATDYLGFNALRDAKLRSSYKQELVYMIEEGIPISEIRQAIPGVLQKAKAIDRCYSFFGRSSEYLDEILDGGLDYETLEYLITHNLLQKSNGQVTEASKSFLNELTEVNSRISKYNLDDYSKTLIENIRNGVSFSLKGGNSGKEVDAILKLGYED